MTLSVNEYVFWIWHRYLRDNLNLFFPLIGTANHILVY